MALVIEWVVCRGHTLLLVRMSKKRLLYAGVVAVVVIGAGVLYLRWYDRVMYLQWVLLRGTIKRDSLLLLHPEIIIALRNSWLSLLIGGCPS